MNQTYEFVEYVECVFESGDTVYKICEHYKIGLNYFKQINSGIKNLDCVLAGEVYYLTTEIINSVEPRENVSIQDIESLDTGFQKMQVAAECFCAAQPQPHKHFVQRGDIVGEICTQYEISLETFQQINPHIKKIDVIFPGQSYIIVAAIQTPPKPNIDYPYFDNNGNPINKEYLDGFYKKSIEKAEKIEKEISPSSTFFLEISNVLFNDEDQQKCLRNRDKEKVEWLINVLDYYFPTFNKKDQESQLKKARGNVDSQKRKRKRNNSQETSSNNQSLQTMPELLGSSNTSNSDNDLSPTQLINNIGQQASQQIFQVHEDANNGRDNSQDGIQPHGILNNSEIINFDIIDKLIEESRNELNCNFPPEHHQNFLTDETNRTTILTNL